MHKLCFFLDKNIHLELTEATKKKLFVYIFFYLTDCDRNSGAHQLIRGSHLNKKFFKHLIGSAKQKKEELEKDYSINDFIVIEGSAGHGFIEDTSCYHRALKPVNKPRLSLQFRYH